MDRTPSDENADDDATNKTPESNPDELEDADETAAPPPEEDGSSSDKNVINDSEPDPESPPDAVDNEPDLENVTDEQEGAPEEEAPEEIADLAEDEVPEEEAAESDVGPEEVLLEENVEEVPLEVEELQEEGEKVEAEEPGLSGEAAEILPVDESKLEESIIEYIEEKVLTEEKELEASDSGQLAMLAESILTAIISSSVVPSVTGPIFKEPGEEMEAVPEAEEVEEELGTFGEEEEAEDGIFPTPRRVKMVDKAVQANAKEIDEALEALSEESLPLEEGGELEVTKSAESGIASEGEVYQSCEETSETADEDRPCGVGDEYEPCPYMEQMGGETDEEGGIAVELEDDSQWEDLQDEGEETLSSVPVEGAEVTDQEGEFEPQDTSAISVPQGPGIPAAPQDTYTPTVPGEASMIQDDSYSPVAQGEAYTPSAVGETYTPSAPPIDALSPKTPQEGFTPKPSVAPGAVRRSESSGGIKPAQPTDTFAPRAVASDTQRRPAGKTAVTPRRESREACEWQQAICDMTDKLFESPYNYICKFVVLCVAIRAIRNIFQATRCG